MWKFYFSGTISSNVAQRLKFFRICFCNIAEKVFKMIVPKLYTICKMRYNTFFLKIWILEELRPTYRLAGLSFLYDPETFKMDLFLNIFFVSKPEFWKWIFRNECWFVWRTDIFFLNFGLFQNKMKLDFNFKNINIHSNEIRIISEKYAELASPKKQMSC